MNYLNFVFINKCDYYVMFQYANYVVCVSYVITLSYTISHKHIFKSHRRTHDSFHLGNLIKHKCQIYSLYVWMSTGVPRSILQ